MTTSPFSVRRLGLADTARAQVLFELMAAVFDEGHARLTEAYVDKLLAREDLWILAAFEGETIVGGLTAHVLPMTRDESRELFLYDLAVAEHVQRRGAGRLLVSELRRFGNEAGIQVSFVPAEEEDAHAIAFYRAIGGQEAKVSFFTFE